MGTTDIQERQKSSMGRLSPESIQEIETELLTPKRLSHYEQHSRQVAIRLIQEFRERIKSGFEISEILAAVRHAVYEMGALEPLQLDRDAEKEAREGGNGEYQAFLKRKTNLCLRALGRQEEESRNEHLGLIRARFLEPDTKKAEQEYFDPSTGKLKISIHGNTPVDALTAILALAEAEHSPVISDSLSLAKSAAQEQLIRRLVSRNEDVIKKGTELFTRRFIDAVIDQMPDSLSEGRIGGKGAGILLAYAALEKETPEFDNKFAAEHGKTAAQLKTILSSGMEFAENQSYFLGSGVFEIFMRENAIGEASIVKDKYKRGDSISQAEFEELRKQILAGSFPRHVERQLKILFSEHLHGKPIICRSSSELEDRQGASFAGQYRSEELANSSDNPDEDFEKFLTAIKEIYASTFNPDVMEYRRAKGLLYEDEEMGILIQTLNGKKHGNFFHPDFSAVTQSRATEATCDNPKHGLLRIGVGLGESVVELNEGVVASLRSPNIREDAPKKQRLVSTLNLSQQSKQCLDWKKLMEEEGLSGDTIEFSVRRYDRDDDRWIECYGTDKMTKYGQMDLHGILKLTNVTLYLEYLTQKLKYIYGHEVDCEFTIQHDRKKNLWTIKLVQCRPLNIPENMRPTIAPKEVLKDPKRVLMHARGCINSTYTTNLSHIFYIDPRLYQDGNHRELTAKSMEYMEAINRVVAKGKCLVLSPRRFGSKDFGSGVPAEFRQFSNMGGVIEVFDGNTVCDPSAGAHFPQLLNDTGMILGHCRDKELNEDFFSQAKHSKKFPSPPKEIEKYVKVIDLGELGDGSVDKSSADISDDRFSSKSGLIAHISQDNTNENPRENFSTLYLAEKDTDTPVQLQV